MSNQSINNSTLLFDDSCFESSKVFTKKYSTSFFSATSLLDRETKEAIYSVYAFVRCADEIVDTFHNFDKETLLNEFEADYYKALDTGISLNPILNAFQKTVKKYNINDDHIQAFLQSMKWDLEKKEYTTTEEINEYIYGSADAVGLICLTIFCNNDCDRYASLEHDAMKLGSAFQKVNFIRDLRDDTQDLQRTYFPELSSEPLNDANKQIIVKDIEKDFKEALRGIKNLPNNSQLAVYVAYVYYKSLLTKIKKSTSDHILARRVRVSNLRKTYLVFVSILRFKLNAIK